VVIPDVLPPDGSAAVVVQLAPDVPPPRPPAMKKKDIETFIHALSESELAPRGFEWKKAPSRPGKAWVCRDAAGGITQMVVPVVTVYGPNSATVVFSFYLSIDSVQSLEVAWTEDPIFRNANPVDSALPMTLGAAALKDCPGGGTLGLTSAADLEASAVQVRRTIVATVEWLERFSTLPTLQAFLATASDEELTVASIVPSRRESLLLQLYFLGGAIDEVRALAQKILDRPDDGNIVGRATRGRAAVALTRS
jgi:hypothetical protein